MTTDTSTVRVRPGGLPIAAATKLARFKTRLDLQIVGMQRATEEAREAHRVKGAIEVQIGRIKTADSGGRYNPRALVEAEERLAIQITESARANAERVRVEKEAEANRGPALNIRLWLEALERPTFIGVEPPVVVRGPSEDWPAVVERFRRRIRELKAEAERVEAAPLPSKVAKAAVAKAVDDLATRGRPDVLPVLEGGEIIWPGQASRDVPAEFDPRTLFAWFDRDRLIERLNAEIDAVADDKAAMTETQKSKALKDLRAAILETEREEEAAIDTAESSSTFILRREDADPRAVLGLADNIPGYEEG